MGNTGHFQNLKIGISNSTSFYHENTHILATFHEEIILRNIAVSRAQTKIFEGPLRKKAIKFKEELVDTPYV